MKKPGDKTVAIFFGVIACSFMPHWACHYYRIETDSSFVVAQWVFSVTESYIAIGIYSAIILLSLLSIAIRATRFISSLLAGIFHLTLGIVHIVRLISPFKFEIFDHEWPPGATWREVLIVTPFGLLCLFLSVLIATKALYSSNPGIPN